MTTKYFALVVCSAVLGLSLNYFSSAAAAPPADTPSATQPPPPELAKAERIRVDIYKKLAPAVVGISCRAKLHNRSGQYYGTGAVVSPDGLVLTDITVIPADATEVKVYFTDMKVLPAEIRKVDARSEGVLIKVQGTNLPYMKLADSSKYEVGDPVYSWGNPHLTIQRDGVVSLSTGTISGLYTAGSVDSQSRYTGSVIETDAAVNPGSDGGPLTDSDGNLLGIMSLAFSQTRWLGLAIPMHQLTEALPELKALKVAPRPLPTPALAAVWGYQAAFGQVAKLTGEGTVGLWVVREGDKVEAPEHRAKQVVAAGGPLPEGQARGRFEALRPPGAASAFFIDSSGHALTAAYHVAVPEKIKHIWVYLPDGQRLSAKLLGADKYTDCAVLKCELPANAKIRGLDLVHDKDLTQGRAVAVLGRSEPPGGYTLNSGTVSGVGRHTGTCAQISALINYGNLGGPVINLKGQVIGMAVKINEKTPWRQNCGVGFLLEADKILEILADLKVGKLIARPKRPFLGVQFAPGPSETKGALIAQLVPFGPAAVAGLLPNDIVVECDGQPVESSVGLAQAIRKKEIGQKIKLKIKRNEEELNVEITVGEQE